MKNLLIVMFLLLSPQPLLGGDILGGTAPNLTSSGGSGSGAKYKPSVKSILAWSGSASSRTIPFTTSYYFGFILTNKCPRNVDSCSQSAMYAPNRTCVRYAGSYPNLTCLQFEETISPASDIMVGATEEWSGGKLACTHPATINSYALTGAARKVLSADECFFFRGKTVYPGYYVINGVKKRDSSVKITKQYWDKYGY